MLRIELPAELDVIVARLDATSHVATISGELDLHNAAELRRRLAPLGEGRRSTVIADLCNVSFIDSTALGVLTALAKELRAGGGELVVATTDPRVRRLLEVTGLLKIMHCEPSLAEAVERVVGHPAA
jgi:anti-anti-sigma factor